MKAQYNIVLFSIVSIALHVALISGFEETVFVPVAPVYGAAVLNVELRQHSNQLEVMNSSIDVNYDAMTGQSSADKVVVHKEKKISDVDVSMTREFVGNVRNKEILTKFEIRKAAEKVQSAVKLVNYSQFNQVIETELEKYFYYPVLAQRRNWQGQVLVEFTVFSSGIIDQIKIRKSSGYSVLDDAALDAVKMIKQADKISLALNGHEINQVLPVNYKLIN